MITRTILGAGGVLVLAMSAGFFSAQPAHANDVLAYGCGNGQNITITINPVTGKGTFADSTAQGEFARAPLVPDQQGAWVNENLGISFFPEPAASPTVSAGDAEFKCEHKEVAAPSAPSAPSTGGGAVATYQCETIVISINPGTGKGSFYDKSAPSERAALSRQRDGAWKDKDDTYFFDPNVSPPTFSAGDAEFKCRKTAATTAAAPPAPSAPSTGGGAVANYQCESIVVSVNTGTGKGSFYDKSAPSERAALSRQRDGSWKDKDDAYFFDPNASPPTFSAGDAEFKCRKTGATAAAAPPASGGSAGAALNAPGLSLGGRLRDQPSMDSNSPGSLAEGAPITILSNTGVSFNGYDWFRVRTPSGMVAFQWGGIMCSKGQLLPGIYQQCF
jgi:hypothetical protein